MRDEKIGGTRCRAARRIVHHRGAVALDTRGTVRYAMENIGRILLHVDFDCGQSLTVLPDDIALEDDRPAA